MPSEGARASLATKPRKVVIGYSTHARNRPTVSTHALHIKVRGVQRPHLRVKSGRQLTTNSATNGPGWSTNRAMTTLTGDHSKPQQAKVTELKLGIVGTGKVGCAVALAAVMRSSAREIVLVNRTRMTAKAVATDLR